MKKILTLLFIMVLGVFSTSCVNTFAIKELNEIAADYLDKGEIENAIARLESSVDLDGNIYESRYNLAVAYIRINECEKALKNIQAAEQLSDNEPAVFYTLGVSYSCVADGIYEQKKENGEIEKKVYDEPEVRYAMAKKYISYLKEANDNYDKYSRLQPNAEDTKAVLEQISQNEKKIADARIEYGIKD